MAPAAVMKAPNTLADSAHSAATKNAASAAASPRSSGVCLGQARHTATTKAAAKISRPASGVGGERSSQCSSNPCQARPESALRPAAAIHRISSASKPSSKSHL